MHRLNHYTLEDFVRERDIAVIMFGAPESEATMAQAIEFADLWADRAGDAAFGYLDALDNVSVARRCGVRVLPTTLVFNAGEIVKRFEGHTPALRIGAAISHTNTFHQAAA